MQPEDLIPLESAFAHGIAEEDMLHAIRNRITVYRQDDRCDMFIGPARPGTPMLEVGVILWYGVYAINHAMPAREKYL